MKHQRSVHSVARVIAFVALNLVMIASVGAQRQEREATVAGRDVTIQVTVHPHNDRISIDQKRGNRHGNLT